MSDFGDVASVTMKEPTIGSFELSDKLKDTGPWIDAANWFYEAFRSGNIYDELIAPLTGDFNRIKANGDAWRYAGTMFWNVADNFSTNAARLTDEHWTDGAASEKFRTHAEFVWTPALYIVNMGCNWVGKGFDKLAQVTIKIANECVELIDKVIKRIVSLFKKTIPVGGWLWSVVDWVRSGLKDFPYISDVMAIHELIDEIVSQYRTITKLAEAAKQYFTAFRDVVEAVATIPTIDSSHDVLSLTSIRGSAEKMRKAREKSEKAFREQYGAMDDGT